MAATTDRNDPGLHRTKPDGQNENHLVLSDEERTKGFVRPVRRTYVHTKCGAATTMGTLIAETYARDPSFYGATFCATCREYFPLRHPDGSAAFTWDDGSPVGS